MDFWGLIEAVYPIGAIVGGVLALLTVTYFAACDAVETQAAQADAVAKGKRTEPPVSLSDAIEWSMVGGGVVVGGVVALAWPVVLTIALLFGTLRGLIGLMTIPARRQIAAEQQAKDNSPEGLARRVVDVRHDISVRLAAIAGDPEAEGERLALTQALEGLKP